MRMKTLWLSMLAVALSAGCGALPGRSKPITHYVLNDPGPVSRAQQTRPGVLLLREMDASAFYQEPRLAYSKQPGTLSHYEFARWSELPGKRLTWLLRQRIEATGLFVGVAPLSSGVVGEYQLNPRLLDFYHDASTAPGVVLLLVEVDLVRRSLGELLARQVFVAQVPVTTFDASGAAEAMNRAANQVLDDITRWLERIGDPTTPRPLPRQSKGGPTADVRVGKIDTSMARQHTTC